MTSITTCEGHLELAPREGLYGVNLGILLLLAFKNSPYQGSECCDPREGRHNLIELTRLEAKIGKSSPDREHITSVTQMNGMNLQEFE